MMYPYMTLNDDTEITHSEMKPDVCSYVFFAVIANILK